jgi:phosphoribosylaminoimidazole carboxylase PurE protein
MENCDVAIVMGSDSDLPIMSEAVRILKKFQISFSLHVMSAHRTPSKVMKFSLNAKKNGIKVIIAGAGGAAHLAGFIAAHTILPVVGVPITSTLDGLDSLLSTVQMPAGIPVATVAIGKAGAANAALLAMQIIAVADKKVAMLLEAHKVEMAKNVDIKDKKIQSLIKDI